MNATSDESGDANEELSARTLEPREMKQAVTVRLEAELIRALRQEATSRKVTVSELMRSAVARYLDELRREQVKLSFHVVNGSASMKTSFAVKGGGGVGYLGAVAHSAEA